MIFNEEYCKFLFKILKNSYILGNDYINANNLFEISNLNYGYRQDKKIIDLFVDILINENMIKIIETYTEELRWSNVMKARLNEIFKNIEFDYLYGKYKSKIDHIDEIFNIKNKIFYYQKKLDNMYKNIDYEFIPIKKYKNIKEDKSFEKLFSENKEKLLFSSENKKKSLIEKYKNKIIKNVLPKKKRLKMKSTNKKEFFSKENNFEENVCKNVKEITSFTDKNKKYLIDFDNLTCSCPSFKYRKNDKKCKHLDYYLKKNNNSNLSQNKKVKNEIVQNEIVQNKTFDDLSNLEGSDLNNDSWDDEGW